MDKLTTRLCLVCGKPIPPKNKKFCSTECAGKARQNYKICPVCGKRFAVSPSSTEVSTCGDAICKTTFRRNLPSTKAAIKYLDKYRDETPPEQLIWSKGWVLKAPDGKVYSCTNLRQFVREHPDLFDADRVKQICGEFYCLKSSILGTIPLRRRRSQWHGWKVLAWSEPNKIECKPKPQPYTLPSAEEMRQKSIGCATCKSRGKIAVCSPDGKIYCPASLLAWAREHCEEISGLPRTEKNARNIVASFSRLKKLGAAKRADGAPYHVYGGWTVIPCETISKYRKKDDKND